MKLHRNAKSTRSSRLLLVRRVLYEGWSYPAAAEGTGVSERTVAKWVRRFRESGIAGLEDDSSRPGTAGDGRAIQPQASQPCGHRRSRNLERMADGPRRQPVLFPQSSDQ